MWSGGQVLIFVVAELVTAGLAILVCWWAWGRRSQPPSWNPSPGPTVQQQEQQKKDVDAAQQVHGATKEDVDSVLGRIRKGP